MALISVDNARSAVLFHLASKPQTATGGDPLADMLDARLDPTPREIFDLNGALLFYDFAILKAGAVIGFARAAADDQLTTPVYLLASRPNAGDSLDAAGAAALLEAELERPVPGDPTLVCYAFPKIGYLFEVPDDGGALLYLVDILERAVHAVADLPVIPEVGEALDDIDGVIAHSILDSELPEAGPVLQDRVKGDFDQILSVASEILPEGSVETDLVFTEDDYERLKEYFSDNPPSISTHMLPIDLIPQITPVYCAAASGQMILKFFGIPLDQEDVATAMNVGEHGTTNRNQFDAYKSLSDDRLAPSFDKSPTFEEAKEAIDRFVPMKSGVPGHARVVRGWKRFTYLSPLTGEILRTEEWLLVNDPYPVGEGSVRWESLNNHNYRNFIYTNRA